VVKYLTGAIRQSKEALHSVFFKDRYVRAAIEMLQKARNELVM